MDHLVGIDDRLGNAGVVRAAQHVQFGCDELLDQGMMPLPAVGASMIAMSSALV
jgi:hypothetical protein